jgi:hypothetical protein
MQASGSSTIHVEIDAQIASLIEEVNGSSTQAQQKEFIDTFQEMLVEQLMGPFGLERAMFDDRNGGPVTTLHNFKDGVTANEGDQKRYEDWKAASEGPIDRSAYDKALKEHSHLFESNMDGYTKRELPAGPRIAARDHVKSVSEIERSPAAQLAQTQEQRVATANQSDNIILTTSSLNSSKRDTDLNVWRNAPNSQDPSRTNAEVYGVDAAAADEAYRRAQAAVEGRIDRDMLMKQGKETAVEAGVAAGKQLVRQMLGMVLKDVVTGVIADIRHLMLSGFDDLRALGAMVEQRIRLTWERVRERWKQYLHEGAGAVVSGFLSTVVTVLVNALVTTVKNFVTMIREAVLSLVRALRLIVAPPPDATAKDIALAVAKILGGAVAACLGLALEESLAKAMQAIPLLAPFATEIAPVIAGMLSGALSLFAVLAFDKLRDHIEFRNKQLADTHRGQAINALQIKRTVFALQSAHQQLAWVRSGLAASFDQTRIEIQATRSLTSSEIAGYRCAVDGLDDAMETFG